ncbi:MAG: EFR1 family ferrodoxin [Clostridia bacterium]|nr:EFR1 family ferrodoxin [Clostridia bacterium]
MRTAIYYFSGTGNSLKISQELAQGLHAQVCPIASAVKSKVINVDAEVVGIVFPVYFLDMPPIVHEFISKLNLKPDTYIFSIINFGGTAGNTLFNLDKLLRTKSMYLSAGFGLKMPDNSIIFATSPSEQQKMFRDANRKLIEISDMVKKRLYAGIEGKNSGAYPLVGKTTGFILERVLMVNKKSAKKHKCTGCGLCEEVCPVSNIQVSDNKVIWKDGCAQCFACIHWCPHNAVRYGFVSLNKKRTYRHPDITVKDIMKQKHANRL